MSDVLIDFVAEFDQRLTERLQPTATIPERIIEAVRYSALSPGKRLRPYFLMQCCELVGGRRDSAWPAAYAIECVHAFSLIHDDLPAMDDDDLRRGKPTCHKQFGEATAILAGDALVFLAFELLADSDLDSPLVASLTRELARASGWNGMIGGQAADLEGEHMPPELHVVRSIHELKTASLFRAACRMGAIVGGATEAELAQLDAFGQTVGLAFQIADDLLDLSGDPEALGKGVGKDASQGKQTYPASVGVEESRRALTAMVGEAQILLDFFGRRADRLRDVVSSLESRHY